MADELTLQLFILKLGSWDPSKGAIWEEGMESDQVLRDRFSRLLGPGDEVESGLTDGVVRKCSSIIVFNLWYAVGFA